MIRFLLFLGLAVAFSAARPAPAEPKLEMGKFDTASLYDDGRLNKLKEVTNKLTPEQKKKIDDATAIMFDRNLSVDDKYNKLAALSENKEMDADKEKMLKEFIGKLNEILQYYDKELLPGVSPKARKVLEAMEDMMKKPIAWMEKSKEEQQAQMLKYAEGMEVDDVFHIYGVMSKLMAKAKELGIIDMHKKLEQQMMTGNEFF
ncbi:hypothetical protein WR25_27182 [Diploscapter pachys]|uniref:SXP/RAL-2 family protein Ani s 5-like cation-binding domain-containing protein n=1 Tax=Diploscapter pachys TaxID=2018661 RepID=A0A2A2L0A9_9BILA|nr:hypothetical protein WR25_27182 [Diploscapter pachys]